MEDKSIINIRFHFYFFLYMDEKWKLSKKELCSASSSSSSHHHASTSSSSSSGKSAFTRSFSTRSSSSKSPLLQKSASTKNNHLPRSFSQKGSSISRKCSSLAKEQKARFYIMRRCVAMLMCWHKHGDPWMMMMMSSCTYITRRLENCLIKERIVIYTYMCHLMICFHPLKLVSSSSS